MDDDKFVKTMIALAVLTAVYIIVGLNAKGTEHLVEILMFLWVISGLCGFIVSATCFGFGGSMESKIIGLMLSVLTGPFYWVYFYFLCEPNYCSRNKSKLKLKLKRKRKIIRNFV